MTFRGHQWRHSLAMAMAMLGPVAAVVLVGELAGYAYLPWLITAGYPAMSLGMLVYMLSRSPEPERRRSAIIMSCTGVLTPGNGGLHVSGGRFRWRSRLSRALRHEGTVP